jgi:hypothetical protein
MVVGGTSGDTFSCTTLPVPASETFEKKRKRKRIKEKERRVK